MQKTSSISNLDDLEAGLCFIWFSLQGGRYIRVIVLRSCFPKDLPRNDLRYCTDEYFKMLMVFFTYVFYTNLFIFIETGSLLR